MSRIYIPARSPEDWKPLLADPDLQWKTGRSARTLATCWQCADGFPESMSTALREAGLNLELLLALPEHRVPLPGGSRPSQTDLFVLARDDTGALITITVEGKAGEPFGPLVRDWLKDDHRGKSRRLRFLLDTLGLPRDPTPSDARYQLLHRAASAVVEASRFNAQQAMMVVHAFGDDHGGFKDYTRFASMMGVNAQRGQIQQTTITSTLPIWIGWIDGEPRFLEA